MKLDVDVPGTITTTRLKAPNHSMGSGSSSVASATCSSGEAVTSGRVLGNAFVSIIYGSRICNRSELTPKGEEVVLFATDKNQKPMYLSLTQKGLIAIAFALIMIFLLLAGIAA